MDGWMFRPVWYIFGNQVFFRSYILRHIWLGVGRYSTKFYTGRLRAPRSNSFTLVNTIFGTRRYFVYHSIPSNETWHLSHSKIRTFPSFNFCKFTFFEMWINNKTRTISRLFHSHKKFLIALRAFSQTGMTEFFSLPYTSELVTFLPFHVPEA